MPWVISALGALAIALALRDIFHTLFHPGGSGSVSRLVAGGVWRFSRLVAVRMRRALALAGPLAVLSVIVTWALLLLVGWALVYWPHLPESFRVASGLSPSRQDGFLDALYLSFVTLATLGYGDITPTAGWLRIAPSGGRAFVACPHAVPAADGRFGRRASARGRGEARGALASARDRRLRGFGERFLGLAGAKTDEILEAYAADHFEEAVGEPRKYPHGVYWDP